jgi:membrane protein YqaA with SNARE-associated domain
MFIDFLQAATRKPSKQISALLRLGLSGLFFLAILDGTPFPTLGGPDILTAVLAGMHRDSWYTCAAVATAGAVIGAYITFWMARRAGAEYLREKFKGGKVAGVVKLFQRWGLSAVAVSAAIPFPFPTSLFFAAAGVSHCRTRTFLSVVTLCRGFRYTLIAILADHYGRHFIRIVRNPTRYWGWLLLFIAILGGLIAAAILVNRRLEGKPGVDSTSDVVPAV